MKFETKTQMVIRIMRSCCCHSNTQMGPTKY